MDILLAANKKVFAPVLTLVYSIFESNPKEDITIWMCHADFEKKEIFLLEKVIGHFGGKLQLLYMRTEMFESLEAGTWPKEIYFRILALEMLPLDLDRILYLDVDMIVKGSLKELYHTELQGFAFAACEDIHGKLTVLAAKEEGSSEIQYEGVLYENVKKTLGIPSDGIYVNSGMILFNLDFFREHHGVQKLLHYIKEELKEYKFPDQDALNVVFCSQIKCLPWEKYNCVPMLYCYQEKNGKKELMNYWELMHRKEKEISMDDILEIFHHAAIIHFAGKRKPWEEGRCDYQAVAIFEVCYQKALEGVLQILEPEN